MIYKFNVGDILINKHNGRSRLVLKVNIISKNYKIRKISSGENITVTKYYLEDAYKLSLKSILNNL